MNAIVVDCSAIVPWFFPEEEEEASLEIRRRVTRAGMQLVAPDLLRAEFGNVAWKKVRRGLCSRELAQEQIALFSRLPILYCTHEPVIAFAFELACREGVTVYDALYLVLARETEVSLATLDMRVRKTAGKMGIVLFGT